MAEQQIPDDIMQAAREALADAMGGRYSFDEFAAVFARAILAERHRSQAVTVPEWQPMDSAPNGDTEIEIRERPRAPRIYRKTAAKARADAGGFVDMLEWRPAPLGAGKEGE